MLPKISLFRALALILTLVASAVFSVQPTSAAAATPATTQDFVKTAVPAHFEGALRRMSQTQAVEIARDHDLLIGHENHFRPHVSAMRQANPDVTVLLYEKGATAPKKMATAYPDEWYLRNAQGEKVRTAPWGSYLMDPRVAGWQDTVVANCLQGIENTGYDGCYFDIFGTGALSIASTAPVTSPGGPEISEAQWHAWLLDFASHVRTSIDPEVELLSNSLGAGRRYARTESPSSELAQAMGSAHAEVWLRIGFSAPDEFRSLADYRLELEMLTDAGSQATPILLTTKLWSSATEAQRSQWRDYSYASFLLANDGSHYFAFTGQETTVELSHPSFDFDIGVPTGTYSEPSPGHFQRSFTNGAALVNGHDVPVTVSLPSGNFVDYLGNVHAGEVTLSPHTGLVLQGQGFNPPTSTPRGPAPPSPTDITCRGYAVTIFGTSGADDIVGTAGDDVIWAGAGKDQIDGLGGDDVICGGNGNDTIYGGPGHDRIFGANGHDIIHGQGGDDLLFGENGNDIIRGHVGNDRIFGGNNDDLLIGGKGNDRCFGSVGTDSARLCELLNAVP